MLSAKNVNNGAQLMENVLHVLMLLTSQLMESVFQLFQLVLKDNTLMFKETVLNLMFFVQISKKLVESALSVFGVMNTV